MVSRTFEALMSRKLPWSTRLMFWWHYKVMGRPMAQGEIGTWVGVKFVERT